MKIVKWMVGSNIAPLAGAVAALLVTAGTAHAQPGDTPDRRADERAERAGGGPSPEEIREFIEQERAGMERRIREFIESRGGGGRGDEPRGGERDGARAEDRRERRVEVRAFGPDGPGAEGERPQRLTFRADATPGAGRPGEQRQRREVRVFIDRGDGMQEIDPRRLRGDRPSDGPGERREQMRREIRIERFGDQGPRGFGGPAERFERRGPASEPMIIAPFDGRRGPGGAQPRVFLFEDHFELRGERGGSHRDGPAWGGRAEPRRIPLRIETHRQGPGARDGRDGPNDMPRDVIVRRYESRSEGTRPGMGQGMGRGGDRGIDRGEGPGPRVYIERFDGGPQQWERRAPGEGEPRVREFRFGPFQGRMELRRMDADPRQDGPDARGTGPRDMRPDPDGMQRREFRIERAPRGDRPVMLLERLPSRRTAGGWDNPV